jgi:hypothetical protein
MTDDPRPVPPPPPPPGTQPTAAEPPTSFNIAEEFGTRSKNLPPIKIVLIGLASIGIVAVVVSLIQRPHASATGAIGDIVSVEIPHQNSIMVAVNVSFQNQGKKPFWIHTMQVELETASDKFSDEPAPAVDMARYMEAFPELKAHALEALKPETKIAPGGSAKGTILVIFPVMSDTFNNRKSIKVTIQPYDQPVPLVMTK